MSDQVWEQQVEQYLTTKTSVLVSPQYQVGDVKWNASIDLLAVDFRMREIWIIEVTTGKGAAIQSKISELNAEIMPRLKSQLLADRIIETPDEWTIGLWAFVREEYRLKILERQPQGVQLKVQSLESIAFPWKYWSDRRSTEGRG